MTAMVQTATGQHSLQLIPVYNIFASSELENRSPIIAEQLIPAVFTVGEQEAQMLGIQQGESLSVTIGNTTVTLPVQIVDYLAENCIGYPVGQVNELTVALNQTISQVSGNGTMQPSNEPLITNQEGENA